MRSAIVWPWLVTSCLVGVGGGTLFAQTPSRQAGELSYGESPGLGSLNPYGSINRSGPTDRLLSMIYEPLFRFNFLAGEGAWENVLATGIASVKPTKGRSAFAVELRQGVEWHDGKPFTATDVISTYFDYLRFLAANARQRQFYTSLLADVRSGASPTQVIFEFNRPVQDAREFLNEFIIPKSRAPVPRVAAADSLDLNRNPVGTGPYRYQSSGSGNVTLVVNDRYHSTRGTIGKVRTRTFSDTPSLLETLLTANGDINLAVEISPQNLARIEANRGYRIGQVQSYNVFAIAIRAKAGSPLANERVRRALTMAVNRDQILDNWYVGKGKVLASPYVPSAPFANPDVKPLPYDPDRARKDLAADGAAGMQLRLVYPASEMAMDTRTADVVRSVKEALEGVGLKVAEIPLHRGDYENTLYKTGAFDLAFVRWEFNPVYDVTPLFHSSERKPGGMNYMSFSDAEVDRRLDEYALATDGGRVQSIVWDLQRMLRDKAPAIFLVSSEMSYAYSNKLQIPPNAVDPFYFFTYVNEWKLVR